MSIQPQNNNLNYLIDPTFTNVNRLFVLSFPRNNYTDSRYSFSNYYVPKVKVNDFNVLIDRKSFFDLSAENDEEAYEKIIDMSNISHYTTGNLLDYAHYKKHHKLIAIDLSKQNKLKDPQKINFIGKLLRNTGANLWQFKRDEITNNADVTNDNNAPSFKYEANRIGNTENNGTKNGVKIAVPLKYLSNFWRSLEMPLINCKVELSLKWYERCLITAATTATFRITDAKLMY